MNLTREQLGEINEARLNPQATHRAVVQALEDILFNPFEVLDHGLIRVIDYMGDDSAIVQAARVSYGKGTQKTRHNAGLINYLMRHRHTTPFEMCEIKFHVKLPVFVARQWIRHRTANVNEYSARYSILDNEFYIPEPEHLAAQSTANRQGRGAVLEGEEAQRVLDILRADAKICYKDYTEMLNENSDGNPVNPERLGLARELARMNLPLNIYTQWYWKIDLHNLFHFLSLRADPHAQYEIRAYAEVMLNIVKIWVPLAFEAFEDHSLNGKNFSGKAFTVLRRMLNGEKVSQENSGLSKREWDELQVSIND